MPVRADKNLLTTGQVARAIGVAPATVSRWSDAGFLPFFRLPSTRSEGDRRFLVRDVVAFCRDRGMPFHFHGHDSPAPAGTIVAASQDGRLFEMLRSYAACTIHPATCTADAVFQCARIMPSILVLDLVVVARGEAIETASCFHFRSPAMRVVLALNEDDPGEGYPDHVGKIQRPFGADQLAAVLLGRLSVPS